MYIPSVKNIKTLALSSLLLAGASSCVQKPYVEMPNKNVSEEVTKTLDSLVQETSKIKADTSYVFYGRDTLLLWSDVASKQKRYLQNINNEAKSKTPNTVVDRKIVLIPTRVGNSTTMRQHVRVVRKPDFIENKAVVSSNKILTRDSVAMYIPVEYYGKHNPEVKEEKENKNIE